MHMKNKTHEIDQYISTSCTAFKDPNQNNTGISYEEGEGRKERGREERMRIRTEETGGVNDACSILVQVIYIHTVPHSLNNRITRVCGRKT